MARKAGTDAGVTRARILDAAIELVARRGYASTSMADLAKEIGMTQGALYWHFGGKEDLLVAAIQELGGRLLAILAKASGDLPPSGGLDHVFRALIERVAGVAAKHPTYFRFIAIVGAEATETSPRAEAALRIAYRRVAELPEALLRQGVKEGIVDPTLDIRYAAQLFLGMYMGGLMHQRLFREELSSKHAHAVLARMMHASVVRDAPPSKKRRR
jgi:AcrR family transcriptional regulator